MDPWQIQRGWEARTDDASAGEIWYWLENVENWSRSWTFQSLRLWKRSQRWKIQLHRLWKRSQRWIFQFHRLWKRSQRWKIQLHRLWKRSQRWIFQFHRLWKRSQRWANPRLSGGTSRIFTLRKSKCFLDEPVWNKPVDLILCRLSDVLVKSTDRCTCTLCFQFLSVVHSCSDFSWTLTIHISSAITCLKSFCTFVLIIMSLCWTAAVVDRVTTQTKICAMISGKFRSEKMKSKCVHHKRQNLEWRNSEYASFESQRELGSERLQFLDDIQRTDQAHREREFFGVANWSWRTIFIENAMQEVVGKLKNWEYAAIRKKKQKNNEDWKNFLRRARSGITNSESILLRSWLTGQLWRTYVPHQALISSSSRKPSREVGMPRNTRPDAADEDQESLNYPETVQGNLSHQDTKDIPETQELQEIQKTRKPRANFGHITSIFQQTVCLTWTRSSRS